MEQCLVQLRLHYSQIEWIKLSWTVFRILTNTTIPCEYPLSSGISVSHLQICASGDPQMLTDTDATWRELLIACIENPEACPMSKHGSDADDLEAKIDELLESLRINPIPAGNTVVDYSWTRNLIGGKLYFPAQ
jgi:hypothetical protein